MSLIDYDGFETWLTGSVGGRYEASAFAGTGTTIGAVGRFGSSGFRFAATSGGGQGNAWIQRTGLPSFTEFVAQFAIRVNSNTGASQEIFEVSEGGTRHLELFISTGTTSFDLLLTRAGTTLATLSAALIAGVYHTIEIKAQIADSAAVEIKIDGTSVYSSTVDTQNGGTGTCNAYRIGNAHGGNTNHSVDVDDFAFITVDGTEPNDFIGDARVSPLRPGGAGALTEFTPSAGSNFQNVDDTTPDDDTTYNSSATVDHDDTFAMSDLPVAATVVGIKEVLRARKTDAGAREIRSLLRISSTNYESAAFALAETYTWYSAVSALSPATAAAFTDTEVNAMEHGYTIES